MKSIFTIEIGYGTTSVVIPTGEDEPMVRTFPSIPVPVRAKNELGVGILEKRRCVEVSVDGITYEVGEDVASSQEARSVRVLNTEVYITSQRYRALMMGALKMLPTNHVDVLVLGLPVSVMSRKQELIDLAQGFHDLGAGRQITVDRVLVFEQPLGALLTYIREGGNERYRQIQNKTLLTCDPGYLTVDWLTTRGLKPNKNRSGDYQQGMSKVLEAVAANLHSQLVKHPAFVRLKEINVELIDQAFITGEIRLFGRSMPFPVHHGDESTPAFDVRSAIASVTSDAVSAIVNKVGDGQDIDEIILAGGPAVIYEPALRHAFPSHRITTLQNSITSVARGLQTAGEQYTKAAIARGEFNKQPVTTVA